MRFLTGSPLPALLAASALVATAAVPMPPARASAPGQGSQGCSLVHTDLQGHAAMVSGGLERRFYVVDGSSGAGPAPLLVSPHPMFADPQAARDVSGFDRLAADRGLIVAYPAALPERSGVWDLSAGSPDDLFMADLARWVMERACVDPGRVVIAGFSQGGMLATLTACRHPRLFRAFGAVAGVADPAGFAEQCQPAGLRGYAVHGAGDQVLRLDGSANDQVVVVLGPRAQGAGRGRLAAVRSLLAGQCTARLDAARDRTGFGTVWSFRCQGQALGAFAVVARGGHEWPSWAGPWLLDQMLAPPVF